MAYYYGKSGSQTFFGVTSKHIREKKNKEKTKIIEVEAPILSSPKQSTSPQKLSETNEKVTVESKSPKVTSYDHCENKSKHEDDSVKRKHYENCTNDSASLSTCSKQTFKRATLDLAGIDGRASSSATTVDLKPVQSHSNFASSDTHSRVSKKASKVEEKAKENHDMQDHVSPKVETKCASLSESPSGYNEAGRPAASAFRPSRQTSNFNMKQCGLGGKYPDRNNDLHDFYRYLRSSGKPSGFARNITTAINKFLYWACEGKEMKWEPIVDSRKLRTYTDLLYKEAKLCESSICNFIGSVDRARQFACYRKRLPAIEYKDDIFLSGLFNRFRALRKTREKEVRASYYNSSFLIDPEELFKIVNHNEYRERYEELVSYAKLLVENKSWQSFDRKNYTFSLRFVLAQLLVTCRPKLAALCSMTFADVEDCEGSWDDTESEVIITVSDRKITSMEGMIVSVIGYAKYALNKFIQYVRLVAPLLQKEAKNLIFVNSNGGKLGPAQINRHMDQFFGTAGYQHINTTRINKSVEHGTKAD